MKQHGSSEDSSGVHSTQPTIVPASRGERSVSKQRDSWSLGILGSAIVGMCSVAVGSDPIASQLDELDVDSGRSLAIFDNAADTASVASAADSAEVALDPARGTWSHEQAPRIRLATETGIFDGYWTGLLPPTRFYHVAIHDLVRDRVVLIGGDGGYPPYATNEVYVWDLVSGLWSEVVPTGEAPPTLVHHTAIYDPIGDRAIVFGGKGFLDELWELRFSSGFEWRRITTTGPQAPGGREFHSAVYDPIAHRMLMFGGWDASEQYHPDPDWPRDPQYLDETWALNLSPEPKWQFLEIPTPPRLSRWRHSAVFDPIQNRMIVFGGESTVGGDNVPNGETWVLSLEAEPSWAEWTFDGDRPAPRRVHTAVFDAEQNRMIVIGGTGPSSSLFSNSDAWYLSLDGPPEWARIESNGSTVLPRAAHQSVLDVNRNRVLLQGGAPEPTRAVWQLNLTAAPSWDLLLEDPLARMPAMGSHSTVYDALRDRLVVYGGSTWGMGFERHNHTFELAMSNVHPVWREFSTPTVPPAVEHHAAIYDPIRDRMIVWGGWDEIGAGLVRIQILDFASGNWGFHRPVTEGCCPGARIMHSAIYDPVGDRMIVFGGFSLVSDSVMDDVWALDLDGPFRWTQIDPPGPAPVARAGHRAAYDPVRHRMIVHGGFSSHGLSTVLHHEVWALSLGDTVRWRELTPSEMGPSGRLLHSIIYDPERDRLVLHGGRDKNPYVLSNFLIHGTADDTWELGLREPATWRQLSPSGGAPGGIAVHTATYDPKRDRMITVGGNSGGDVRETYFLTWGYPRIDASIDVRPGEDESKVNPLSRGVLPIAVLGTEEFDVHTIDVSSLELNGMSYVPHCQTCPPVRFEDVNGDAISDLMVHPIIEDLQLGGSEAVLTFEARTVQGRRISGEEEVQLQTIPGRQELGPEADLSRPTTFSARMRSQNPTSGHLLIALMNPTAQRVRFEVIDVAGRTQVQRSGWFEAGEHDVQVPEIKVLPSGVYFVRIRTQRDLELLRIVHLR